MKEAQTLDDLEHLVALARGIGVRPRSFSLGEKARESDDGRHARRRPIWPDWRLPPEIAERHIVQPFREICRRRRVPHEGLE